MIVAGCPIYGRSWVLEEWFRRLETWPIDQFVFVYTPDESPTLDIIFDRAPDARVIVVEDGPHAEGRDWNTERLHLMVRLRNLLWEEVRSLEPSYFLSLDSDILAAPWKESQELFADFDVVDAVAPLVYLHERTPLPNAFYRQGPGRTPRRVQNTYDCLLHVQVICAAKLITRKVLRDRNVRYEFHPSGEDIGWSQTAIGAGHHLGLDSRVKFKHVMSPKWLDQVDERIGW